MLPIMSGEDFIKEIRKISDVHIIVISAKTENSSKIESLKLGADDYLCKPFLQEEVELKINNLFNKKDSINKNKTFNNNEVLFIEGKTTITVNNEEVLLTAIEYRILKLLIDEAGRVITREQFLDNLYSYGDEVYDRVIDVHITNIRRKIKKHYKKELIKTIYGLGYCFVGDKDE
jgi:DNA-binding response OmpR family regulator